ncbi:EH signature domain-containing protein [Terrisporobacter sp.]
MSKYILPDFKRLNPYKINKVNEKIKLSKTYNPEVEVKPTKDIYQRSLSKLVQNQDLMSKDYKILIFYLDDIERRGMFNKLINSFFNDLLKFPSHRKFLRPLTYYIYNNYDTSINLKEVYKSLYIVGKNLKDKEKYKFIKYKIDLNKDVKMFLNSVKREFYSCNNEDDIEVTMKKVFMRKTDKFYLSCMVKFIIENHRNENLYKDFFSAIKLMSLDLKKEVFVGILEVYVNENDVDKYPDPWFKLILDYLDDPYSSTNTKWSGIRNELKEVFRRWNNSTQLYNFFMNITGYVDEERLEFWKDYIENIYRIRYYEHLENALVMEFKNHVFIEFAKHGNASYIYDKRIKSIDDISMNSQKYKSASDLKDPYQGTKMIHYNGVWQEKFSDTIRNLGYKKSRW